MDEGGVTVRAREVVKLSDGATVITEMFRSDNCLATEDGATVSKQTEARDIL